jgi:hypothetical protein
MRRWRRVRSLGRSRRRQASVSRDVFRDDSDSERRLIRHRATHIARFAPAEPVGGFRMERVDPGARRRRCATLK